MDKNELVTLADAKSMLGVSRTQMYRYFEQGMLKPIRINPIKQRQPLYFYRRDIERFIQRRLAMAS